MYLELGNQHQNNHAPTYNTGIGFSLRNIHAFAVYHGLIYSNSPDKVICTVLYHKKTPQPQTKNLNKKQATTKKTPHATE